MLTLSPTRPGGARKFWIGLLLAGTAAVTLLSLGPGAQPASALCIARPEYGDWVNVNKTDPGIASLRLTSSDSCTSYMSVWGKCTPTNCAWGKVPAPFSNGRLRGYYDQGFAKRWVYAKMSGNRPGQLWVQWRTDFVDPNRADYTKQEWYVHP